jgi:NAD(P)-dependent dehydrogenase (short-subunit alcohol dehydrogenase family)
VELDGCAAIVTGGASGLGEATARRLSRSGARVVIVDLQDDAGKQVAKDVDATYVHADVTEPDDVIGAIRRAGEMGPLRVLVNCAGIAIAQRVIGRDGGFETAHSLAAFERVIAVNLLGTFNCVRLATSIMSRLEPLDDGERGAIVNTASIAAFDGQTGQTAYSASKGGIVGMTLPLARDLAVVGIRVNTIAPGLFETPIYGAGADAEERKQKLQQQALFPPRLGATDEFARLAVELLTNGYVNGETIRLDAGARLPAR